MVDKLDMNKQLIFLELLENFTTIKLANFIMLYSNCDRAHVSENT